MSTEAGLIVVTGGGTGIGRAVVHAIVETGLNCLVIGRSRETLEETARTCSDHPGQVVVQVADVSEPEDVSAILAAALEMGVPLMGVVNNAAMAGLALFPEWKADQIEAMLKTNVVGPLNLVQAAWPYLVESGGRVINISSLAVLGPFPGNGLYGMTKCALDGLTRAIHADAGESGVKAFSIAPGAVETDMLQTIVDETQLPPAKAMPPAEIARLVMACLAGEQDQHAGDVLYAAIPDFVTNDPDEAMAAMGRFHGS